MKRAQKLVIFGCTAAICFTALAFACRDAKPAQALQPSREDRIAELAERLAAPRLEMLLKVAAPTPDHFEKVFKGYVDLAVPFVDAEDAIDRICKNRGLSAEVRAKAKEHLGSFRSIHDVDAAAKRCIAWAEKRLRVLAAAREGLRRAAKGR